MVTALAVNINSPSPARAARQLRALLASGAEVLVLTEVKDSAGATALVAGLRANGYHVIGWSDQAFDGFTTLIGSKIAFDAGSREPGRTQRITLHTQPEISLLAAYGVSSDPFGRNDEVKIRAKREWLEAFVRDARTQLDAGNLLVLGDLNIVDDRQVSQYRSLYDFERTAYRELVALPLSDLLREKEEYSWISHQGLGFRFDHVLVSGALVNHVGSSTYDHEWRAGPDRLTDHSGVRIEITATFESLESPEVSGSNQTTLF